jgi:hypothetical protein
VPVFPHSLSLRYVDPRADSRAAACHHLCCCSLQQLPSLQLVDLSGNSFTSDSSSSGSLPAGVVVDR